MTYQEELDEAAKQDCKTCGSESLPQMKVCDVCLLIDKDESIKLCKWCQSCNAWICESDVTNWFRRGRAFFKR